MSVLSNTGIRMGASAAGGDPVYVEDVFSTHLYMGIDTTGRDIVNNIDLAGEGGMVWIKNRAGSGKDHSLSDTERGAGKTIYSNENYAEAATATRVSGFNSNGFEIGNDDTVNGNGDDYASWTFRKCPGFFDVVTWTGSGTTDTNHRISHSLGCVPGCILVKKTDGTQDWRVYHKEVGVDSYQALNNSTAFTSGFNCFGSAPTSTDFGINEDNLSMSSGNFVAYLFADGDQSDAQVFGDDGDQSIIKCGIYTGNNSTTGPIIDLGWEPQFLIIKKTTAADAWNLKDYMRGPSVQLYPHTAGSEPTADPGTRVEPQPKGFQIKNADGSYNSNTYDGTGVDPKYIYIAIRRGPMKTPEAGTEVFTPIAADSPGTTAQRPENVDMMWFTKRSVVWGEQFQVADRVRGFQIVTSLGDDSHTSPWFPTNDTNLEATSGGAICQYSNAVGSPFVTAASSGSSFLNYFFKRAPGFFDIVGYTGTGSARLEDHNLGVTPELIIIKRRDSGGNWVVGHKDMNDGTNPWSYYLWLNTNDGRGSSGNYFDDTAPTATQFRLGGSNDVNGNTYTYISYLFASLDGVSKVGTYSSTGSDVTVNCGFSPRFILVKSSDTNTGHWYALDTARGLVSGNDYWIELDETTAESDDDLIDPTGSGFTVHPNNFFNADTGKDYIFLAIA